MSALLDEIVAGLDECEKDTRDFFDTEAPWTAERRARAALRLDTLEQARVLLERTVNETPLPAHRAKCLRERARDVAFWIGEWRDRWAESERERGMAN